MNAFDGRIRARVFRHVIVTATGPVPAEIAEESGDPVDEVTKSFRRLAGDHRIVLRTDDDRVLMAHPFSGVPTRYRATIGGDGWYANCGWGAFAILALLGDGHVEATAAVDGSITRWRVRDGTVSPGGLVHFVVPARDFWDDIGFT